MILAYRYYHARPFLQPRVARIDLVKTIRESFQGSDWNVSEEKGWMLLTHVPTQSEVRVQVHGWDIMVEYADTDVEEETYLVALTSNCLAWKRGEEEHKRLMREVLKKLSWEEKVGCHIEDGRFMVVYSSNIQRGFEPFPVTPRIWQECPIPEQRRRKRLLRMKSPTSYLGTRVKIPRRRLRSAFPSVKDAILQPTTLFSSSSVLSAVMKIGTFSMPVAM
jgi:hypothetical protein